MKPKLNKPDRKIDPNTVNAAIATRVLAVVDKGLVYGLGDPKPGSMCVEAAVAYAYGEDHSDGPICVDNNLRSFKIDLNDSLTFKSNKSRAQALRRIAIAQLGTFKKGYKFKYADFLKDSRGALLQNVFPNYLPATSPLAKKLLPAIQNHLKKNPGDFEAALNFLNEDSGYSNFSPTDSLDIPSEFIDNFANCVDLADGSARRAKFNNECIEEFVQVLRRMKTPGSKYLYLTK